MKKSLLLMMMCIPAALVAQTQNGVTVSGLEVNAGTVTFNVSWEKPMPVEVWVDSAWVFVDYNKNGVMERLPVTGATATAGTVTKISGNDKGVWVAGDARTKGSFSATVQLLTAIQGVAGACAYASNYPPVGEYIENGIKFTGTAPYTVVLEDSEGKATTYTVDSPFSFPDGCTVKSFTDKTGAPGRLKCIPMTGDIDFSVPAGMPKGLATSFAVLQHNLSIPNAAAVTYTWSAPDFTPNTYTGTPYSPTAPANTGAYTVTLTAHSTDYCDLATSKNVTVIDCNPSTVHTLEASASGFCADDAGVTFSLSETENGRSYTLYKGDGIVATLMGTGYAAAFSGFQTEGIYTAKVLASGGDCEAAMSGTPITISRNPLPEAPVISQPADVCLNGGDIVFTATGYTGSLEWVLTGGGSVNGNSVTFAGTATGTKTVTARSGKTFTDAPTCYSEEVTQWADVLALPDTPTLAVSASTVCLGTNIVFRVTSLVSEATYTWSGAAGTASGTGDGIYTVSSATTGTVSVTAYARLSSNGTACQSGNSSLSAVVSQPGSKGQASDATCGCASGTTPCNNVCTTSSTYTKDDGACTGACNRAYVRQYDQCGKVINAMYSTYTKSTCTSGCITYDQSCYNNGGVDITSVGTASSRDVCQTYCIVGAPSGTKRYGYGWGTDTHTCWCAWCKN